jgi:hypothetical protein
VADQLRTLLLDHAGDFFTPAERAALTTAVVAARANAAQNERDLAAGIIGKPEGFPAGRLPRRQKHDPAQAETLPPYRVRQEYSTLLAAAIRAWGQECKHRYHHAASDAHQRDYRLELADLAAVMPRVPQDVRGGAAHAFDISITKAEWDAISRALRHLARTTHPKGNCDGPAYVLYQHWRKHRFAGYPFVPAVQKAQRDELISKLAGQ